MGDLSPRLSRKEFACKCGCGFCVCDKDLILHLEDLADDLQTENGVSRSIICINSACRCSAYNQKVGGEDRSKHLWGMAVDFHIDLIDHSGKRWKVDPGLIADRLSKAFPNKYGIGRYPTFTHFDVRQDNARW